MRGERTVRVECLMPEKLLARALERGARFDAVRREDERTVTVDCDAASAEILLEQCARFRLPARTLARRGRSALTAYARRRLTLPVGLLAGVALCWFFLSHIWLVGIAFSGEAASLGDEGALRRAVEAAGIRPGISRQIDAQALEQSLRAGAGDYSYVGLHLRGIRLLVEAAPELPSPSLYDVSAARDLVSDRDGIVVSAVARSGELCVQPGDAVRRGQLLIRGEELATKEETRPIAALGEVVLRTWLTGEAQLPLDRTRVTETGRSSASASLRAPWLTVSIAEGERYADQVEATEYLPVGGLFVPVELVRVTRREVRRSREAVDEALLKARLLPLAFADAALALRREGLEGCEVLRSWVDYDASGGCLRARAVLEIAADAAVTREALRAQATPSAQAAK